MTFKNKTFDFHNEYRYRFYCNCGWYRLVKVNRDYDLKKI